MKENLLKSQTKPLDPLERIGLFGYAILCQFPPKYRIPLSAVKAAFALALDVSQGKVASQSPVELRHKIFSNYETVAKGVENIPQDGPFIIASNHYNEGPLRGRWQTGAIADVILNNIPKKKKYRFRFIMDWKKDSTDIFGKSIADRFEKGLRHGIENIAAALDYIPLNNIREVIESVRQGKNGDSIIGIFPTGKAELAFKTPAPKTAGNLFEIAGRYGIPIVPIGTWCDVDKKTFVINVGKAVLYRNSPEDPNSKQTTIERVMHDIALLLPLEMRGIYGIS